MNAIATPARSGTKAQAAPASKPASVSTKPQIRAWCEALAHALAEAADTEEQLTWSGDSDRLLRVAHQLAADLVASPTDHPDCTPQNRVYTIAALIKAALQVPGDTPSIGRLAFIEQARVPLVALTGDPAVLDGWETYPDGRSQP